MGYGSTNAMTLSGGGSADYYKCASVNTSNQTWTGYKLLNNGGVYSFDSTATTGLTYTTISPQWGGVYSESADMQLFEIKGLSIIPNPLFHASLKSAMQYAETGQELTNIGTMAYTTDGGVPCGDFANGRIAFLPTDFVTGGGVFSMSFWAKGEASDKQRCVFSYGDDLGNHAVAIMFAPDNTVKVIGTHDAENEWTSSENAIDQTTWNNIVYVNFGTYEYIYANGLKIGEFTYSREVRRTNGRIGQLVTDTTFDYYGKIAAVRYYNVALNATQAAELATEF